jgi:hypothetical protein
MVRRYLPILVLLLVGRVATAQLRDSVRTFRTDSAAAASTTETGYVMTKSPTKAILFSIIPGGGQLYNEQYWKIPLFTGAAAYFLWRTIYFHNLYIDKAAEASRAANDPSLYSVLKAEREQDRDDRDRNGAYVLAVEIIGMIDAYVGAHMFDFDVDGDISSRIYLTPVNPGVGLEMRW